jgi:NAD(P)-dependent dehydrogenase (short-subunit alcohol dehydrogenase family)
MENPMDMSGRNVLVTGASSGLGSAIARGLAKQGAKIVLAGRDRGRLAATADSLVGSGHVVQPFDLLDYDSVPQRLRDIASLQGSLHGLVHSAGIMGLRPLRMVSATDWDLSLRTNLIAAGALAKGFRQKGVNASGGSVVFLASVTGLTGHAAQGVYSATKGALIALARSLAIELAPENIRVNCVAPAVVEVGMSEKLKSGMTPEQWSHVASLHPLGIGRPEDIAHAVNFLLADTARWITGTTLVVDGGYTAQ